MFTRKATLPVLSLIVLCTAPTLAQTNGPVRSLRHTPPPRPRIAPQIAKQYPNDLDHDALEDTLQVRASHAVTPADSSVMVNVELIFTEPITQNQLDSFEALGGTIDHVFQTISYGWVGSVPLRSIPLLRHDLGGTLILTQEAKPMSLLLMKATQSGRVRTIWASSFNNGTGYDGSTNITIGFTDSGIDESHPDLSGRKKFWSDYSFDASSNPVDYVQHGTHVAGIALGSGSAGGSNTATLYYTQVGDLSPIASNSFIGATVAFPTSSITWTSGAKWTGGGTTSLRHMYSPNGSQSFTAFSTNSGTSPITRVDTFIPTNSRKYTAGLISLGNSTVDKFVVTNIVPSYPGVGDGFNRFRGVAPGCNWAAAKVTTSNETMTTPWVTAALDDLVTARVTNKIKIINMSVTANAVDASVRQKVNTTVDNGIVVVASAGNDGQTSGTVYDPARAAKAITVGAANAVNQLTEYTSLGVTSLETTTGQETDYKPDLMAPGGSDYYTHILAPDSNSGDGYKFPDQQTNDYTTEEGTSMSAPFVSGCSALIIDAMESSGYTWNFYTNDQPLFVKMLLCATATESNTNRESNADNPSLQRDTAGPNNYPNGKDRYEGYGMINPDAAIEAIVKSQPLNWSTNDTLGTNSSDRRAWARKISFLGGQKVTTSLIVPSTGDFDLYLYSYMPGDYGAPSALYSSTSTGTNVDETIIYTSATNETAFLVVKRISGYGTFTLTTTNSNDAFSNAFTLASTYDGSNYIFNASSSQTGSNAGYTTESNEPSEISFGGGRSAWFNWKAPYTGQAYLSCNKSVQTYTGSNVTNLTTVGSGVNSSSETFNTVAGTTYRIAVFGGGGNYTLTLSTVGITSLPLTNSMSIVSNSAGSGPSVPYPSSITISGVTQTILNITATLFDMTHTRCADYDIGLVDPATNWPVYLMSDAGGNTNVDHITLTFDDTSSSNIPAGIPPTNGTYHPMDYFFVGDKPSGAPGTFTNTFSGLFGTLPNGKWSLYAYDDQNINLVGNIAGGWALNLTFDRPPSMVFMTDTIDYNENSSPTSLQPYAQLTDPDSTNFMGGWLTLQYTTNGTVDDRLSVTNQGTGAGQIGVSGTNLSYGGSTFGTFSGGSGTNALHITFTTTSATPAAAQQLLTRLTYYNVSDAPSTNPRALIGTISDGDGVDGSATFTETINVFASNDPPTLTAINTITGAIEDTAFNVTYTVLTNAADEADPDGDAISFRVESVTSGTLKKNGTNVTTGVTLLTNGETWVWTPASNVNGAAVAAFTVRAKDAITNSTSAIQVNIGVTNVNDAPIVANTNAIQTGTNGISFSYTFATNVFTDVDTGQTLTYTASSMPPGLVLTNATRTFSGTPTQAGSYAVALVGTDNGAPAAAATNTFTITISKASLLVTASNVSRAYGSTNPAFLATYSGFVNSQSFTNSGITGTPALTSGATTSSIPAAYTISNAIGTLASSNYSFTLSNGTLTVTKAALLVTASNVSRVYGTANPGFAATYSGFVNGQTLGTSGVTGTPSLTCSATTNSVVGGYTISNTIGTLAATNYSFTLTNGTMTVTNKPMSVTAGNFSRPYGAANPSFTGTVVGVTAGDVITSSFATVAASTSSPGAYAITPTLVDPGTRLGNYTVTSSNGTLTITQAPLLVTASNVGRVYGDTNPLLQATYNGFMNGETRGTSDLTGAPAINTAVTNNSPVGSYAIFCTSGTLASTNYALSYSNGTFTVSAATLVCGAAEIQRVYGATNPALLYSFYPFANGETLGTSDVTGLPVLTTAATPTSPVGSYAISVAIGTLTSSNYNFALGNNWFIINPAPLSVTPDSYSRLYGETNPVLTGVVTGIVNGENITAAYSTTAVTSSPAGGYPITALLIDPDGKLSNYTATTNQGTLTITNAIPSNALPAVILLSPTNGMIFFAGTTHTVSATPSDTDGTVAKVEFLADGTAVTESTNSPYNAIWTNLFAGTILFNARVTDNQNGVATSPIVTVVSQPYLRNPQWQSASNAPFSMTFYGVTGATFDLQYSADLASWTNLTTFVITNGGTTVTDTNASSTKKRFYRAIQSP